MGGCGASSVVSQAAWLVEVEMKRDIIFRLYDKALGRMICPGDLRYPEYRISLAGPVICGDVWCTNDVVLMQYTGMTDRAGAKIFEGDIMKSRTWKNKACPKCGHQEKTYALDVVTWGNYNFGPDYPNNFGAWCLGEDRNHRLTD